MVIVPAVKLGVCKLFMPFVLSVISPLLSQVSFFKIIAVAGGAYYLGTLKNKPQTQNPVVTSQTVPPSPSPISDLTANWKTYINTAYGYQISYPPLKV